MIRLTDLLFEDISNTSFAIKTTNNVDYVVHAKVNNNIIGELHFIKSQFKPVLKGILVSVDPYYQRKGIGSAMYEFAEKELGLKFVKNDDALTADGKLLWNNPNRLLSGPK